MVKHSDFLIFLPAYSLIMWFMRSSKNFEKIAILKISELVSFWSVKTYFSKTPQKWCIFRHEQDRRYSDPKARNGKKIIGQKKISRKIKIRQKNLLVEIHWSKIHSSENSSVKKFVGHKFHRSENTSVKNSSVGKFLGQKICRVYIP